MASEHTPEHTTPGPTESDPSSLQVWKYAKLAAAANIPKRQDLPEDVQQVASAIENTYLNITDPENDDNEVERVCREAATYGFAAVCIRPDKVKLARSLLTTWGSDDVRVCTVIGFPRESGYDPNAWHDEGGTPEMMAKETEQAVEDGADEFDLVINTRMILDCDIDGAMDGIRAVVAEVKEANDADGGDRTVKTIIEAPHLRTRGREKALFDAFEAVISGKSDYIKTSTGFKPLGLGTGATPEDVALMVQWCKVPHGIKVKAAGGIGTPDDAKLMRAIGADRLGTSKGVKIIKSMLEESG